MALRHLTIALVSLALLPLAGAGCWPHDDPDEPPQVIQPDPPNDPVDPEDLLPSFVVAGVLLWTAAIDPRPETREAFEAAPATCALGLDPSEIDEIMKGMAEAVPECLEAAGQPRGKKNVQ